MKARERAEAEWARVQERPAARDRVERLNDVALEAAIAAARVGSAAGFGTLTVLVPLAIVLGEWRYALAVAAVAAFVGVMGWWGWWYYGNEGWRKGTTTDEGE